MINPKYLESFEVEVTCPEITEVVYDAQGNLISFKYIGTGEESIYLPKYPEVGPKKRMKITEYRVKEEFSHLCLAELMS